MAEASQYVFSHTELVVALIRQQGLHEGLWMLSVRFNLRVQNFKPKNEGPPNPGATVFIENICLQRATSEIPNVTVDAAKINPIPVKAIVEVPNKLPRGITKRRPS
jgi:hypothetical protein